MIKRASGYHYLDVPVSNTRDYSEDRLFFRQITQILPNMKTAPPSQAGRLTLIIKILFKLFHAANYLHRRYLVFKIIGFNRKHYISIKREEPIHYINRDMKCFR